MPSSDRWPRILTPCCFCFQGQLVTADLDQLLQVDLQPSSCMQARQEVWERISLDTRSWFAWPPSGRPRQQDGGAFRALVSCHPKACCEGARNVKPCWCTG